MAALVFVFVVIELMDYIEDIDSRSEFGAPAEIDTVEFIERDDARQAQDTIFVDPAECARHAL